MSRFIAVFIVDGIPIAGEIQSVGSERTGDMQIIHIPGRITGMRRITRSSGYLLFESARFALRVFIRRASGRGQKVCRSRPQDEQGQK
jgi:hypothetical protein